MLPWIILTIIPGPESANQNIIVYLVLEIVLGDIYAALEVGPEYPEIHRDPSLETSKYQSIGMILKIVFTLILIR